MFRSALNQIAAHSHNTAMIDDRMHTDVVAEIEAELHTILVLTGISDQAEIERFPQTRRGAGFGRRAARVARGFDRSVGSRGSGVEGPPNG